MLKELILQNIWESDIPVENGSTFKIKSTLWWPVLVEGLSLRSKNVFSTTAPHLFHAVKIMFCEPAGIGEMSLAILRDEGRIQCHV